MTGVTYEEWVRKFGVPVLDGVPAFRDDDRHGPWSCFDAFDLRTATRREIAQAGYEPRPGERFCRLSRVWGLDPEDGTPVIACIVFTIADRLVDALNRSPADFFDVLWATMVRHGAKVVTAGRVS